MPYDKEMYRYYERRFSEIYKEIHKVQPAITKSIRPFSPPPIPVNTSQLRKVLDELFALETPQQKNSELDDRAAQNTNIQFVEMARFTAVSFCLGSIVYSTKYKRKNNNTVLQFSNNPNEVEKDAREIMLRGPHKTARHTSIADPQLIYEFLYEHVFNLKK